MSLAEPQNDWPLFAVVVEHCYNTYSAKKAAKKLEDSDGPLESEFTDKELPRKRKKPAKYMSDSDPDPPDSPVKRLKSIKSTSENSNPSKCRRQEVMSSDSEHEEVPAPKSLGEVQAIVKAVNKKTETEMKQRLLNRSTAPRKTVVTVQQNPERKIRSPKSMQISPSWNVEDAPVSPATTVAVSSPEQENFSPSKSSSLTRQNADLSLGFDHIRNLFTGGHQDDAVDCDMDVVDDVGSPQHGSNDSMLPNSPLKSTVDAARKRSLIIRQSLLKASGKAATSCSSIGGGVPRERKEVVSSPAKRKPMGKVWKSPRTKSKAAPRNGLQIVKDVNVVLAEIIQEFSSKIDMVMMQLSRITKKLLPEEESILRPDQMPSLPLSSEDDFKEFEAYLKDTFNLSTTVTFFTSLIRVHEDKAKATGVLLTKLFSDAFSRLMSWAGTADTKIVLRTSRTYEMIQCVLLTRFPKTDFSVELAKLKRWFNTSGAKKV